MNYSMFNEIDYFTNFKEKKSFKNSDDCKNNYEYKNNLNIDNQDLENDLNQEVTVLNNLESPYEGYLRGNLFKNLYDEYKNYKPRKIMIRSEREEMLLNIGQIGFAAHDLNLYLDNYPNDKGVLDLFHKYNAMALKLRNEYERKYGPLSVSGSDEKIPFSWENEKWPWEV